MNSHANVENSIPDPTLSYYMDENVDFAITTGLRERGVNILTVQEDSRGGISDPEVMARALELVRVVFTNDDDLLREATQHQENGTEFSGVIYIHKRDVIVGRCIDALDLISRTTYATDFLKHVEWLKNFF